MHDGPSTRLIQIAAASGESDATIHITELQRRRMGYAFGGPDMKWCAVPSDKHMMLPEDPGVTSSRAARAPFQGCLKYATCDLIPDEHTRWTPWDQLSESEQQILQRINCYRSNGTFWDRGALASRESHSEGRWIANPFGLRTPRLQERAALLGAHERSMHRDLVPCPVGGCVTPEMQRDYEWEQRQSNGHKSADWSSVRACPYYFRHTDHRLTSAVPNSQRFTQCYVNMPAFRRYLRERGLIVAVPIFRSSQRAESLGEAFWYPFYSGFAYLQLPTSNLLETAQDRFAALRWQATTLARLQQAKTFVDSGTQRILRGAERGEFLADWERASRVVSISEGQASAVLLATSDLNLGMVRH